MTLLFELYGHPLFEKDIKHSCVQNANGLAIHLLSSRGSKYTIVAGTEPLKSVKDNMLSDTEELYFAYLMEDKLANRVGKVIILLFGEDGTDYQAPLLPRFFDIKEYFPIQVNRGLIEVLCQNGNMPSRSKQSKQSKLEDHGIEGLTCG